MGFKATPLPHEYMIIGFIGFFISVFWLMSYSVTWGVALAIFFLLLVISSIVSVSSADLDEDTLDLIGGEQYQSKKRQTLKGGKV